MQGLDDGCRNSIPAWRKGVKARNEFGQGHVQGIAKAI